MILREKNTPAVARREFSCQRDGLTVRGLEFRGPGENLPIVIVSHGFLANYGTTKGYAAQLARWGYAAYCFDFGGGCVIGRSDGRTEDMTVLTEVEDLLAVIGYARTVPGNDAARLSLVGCSQGGLVSALTAARLGERVERLALFYPALCIPDDARAGKMMFYKFDPADPPETLTGGPIRLGRGYALSVRDLDVMAEIAKYPGPVLILHGTEDRVVAPAYAGRAREAYDAAVPRRCQLALLEGAGHGFDRRADGAALDILRPFMEGMSLILEVDVKLSENTGFAWTPLEHTRILPFTGSCATGWFTGEVKPGAKDVQRRRLGGRVHFCAEYDLAGTDYTGQPCTVHVKNENFGAGWIPTLLTDSPALNFLNTAPAMTAVEGRPGGVLVRIFAEV